MYIDLFSGQIPTTTSPTNVVSNVPKTNECRDYFIAAIDCFIQHLESSNGRAAFLPSCLDYDGDPDANYIEMRSLWVTLVCMFGEPYKDEPEYGHITMVPEAYQYLRLLKTIMSNPAWTKYVPESSLTEQMSSILEARRTFKREGGLNGQKQEQ